MNIEPHLPKLRCYAIQLTKDSEQAADLVQQTCLLALENAHRFDGRNLGGWLGTIMHNAFINNCRRKAHRPQPTERNTLNPALNRLRLAEVWKRLEQYPATLSAMQLFASGYKYEEIAEQLQVPVGTVKTRIFFARKYLVGV